MTPHERPLPGPAASFGAALSAGIPVLETERTRLRAPALADFDDWCRVLHGPNTADLGGPFTRDEAFAEFCTCVATWLLRGHGLWTVEDRTTTERLGFVLLGFEPGDLEPELGWLFLPEAQGKGLAAEAARAARAHALGPLGLPALVSYITPGNIRSERLATRLGARPEPGPDGCTAWRHAPEAEGPTLTTARLILRRPRLSDLPACAAFWASDRSRLMGGPWTAAETARELDDLLAQWHKHGFSLFTVTLKGSDDAIGLIGPFFPDTHPEPELGWSLWDAALEGRGLATEAAIAARDWFFATSGHQTAVSYTHPDNAASHRLCESLGAVLDTQAPCPYPPPVRIYRHTAPLRMS